MILRDGRRTVHDLGPVRHGNNVLHGLSHIATAMLDDQSWRNMNFLFRQPNARPRKTKQYEKNCKFPHCAIAFTTDNHQRRYCSDRCMKKYYDVRTGRRNHKGKTND